MAPRSYRSGERRYPVLWIASLVLEAVGILGMALGGALLLVALGFRETRDFALPGVCSLAGGLVCFAYAEVIRMMIHTEENTRATAYLLAQLANKLEGPQPIVGRLEPTAVEQTQPPAPRSTAATGAPSAAPPPKWRITGVGQSGQQVVRVVVAETQVEAQAAAILDGLRVLSVDRVK